MIEKFIHNISIACVDKIQGDEKYSELKYAKIAFSVEMLISEGSKILIVLLIFAMWGKLYEYVFCFGVLLVTRCFTGGIHAKTYLGCLIMSIVFFGLGVIVKENSQINIYVAIVMLMIYVLVILIIAPIQSKNRIKFGRRKRYIQKAIAVISAVTIFVIVKYVCIQNLTMLVYVYWFQLCGGIYAVLQSRKVK